MFSKKFPSILLGVTLLVGCTQVEVPGNTRCSRDSVQVQFNDLMPPETREAIDGMTVGRDYSAWLSYGRIFARGHNPNRRLGLPERLLTTPTRVPIPTKHWSIKLSGGDMGFFVLGCDHRLFKIGSPAQEIFVDNKNVYDVSMGWSHFLAIGSFKANEVGQLFAWGSNNDGQLGLGHTNDQTTPMAVSYPKQNGQDVVSYTRQISAGAEHSMAIVQMKPGQGGIVLYTWGQNVFRQLGVGDTSNRLVPTRVGHPTDVPANFHFVQISAGQQHSMALGSDGQIYTWGNNSSGQLGIINTAFKSLPTRVAHPTGVPANFHFVQISAGQQHSMALGSDGQIYTWGQNQYGALGTGDEIDRFIPTRIPLPENVSANFRFTAVVGNSFAEHVLAKGNDGHVYGWGSNIFQQLEIFKTTQDNGGRLRVLNTMVTAPVLIQETYD